MPEAAYNRSNRWLTVILVDLDKFGADSETIRLALEKENIESRPVWKPMHLQPVFQANRELEAESNPPSPIAHCPLPATGVIGGKVSEELFEKGLCLPSGTAMDEEDLERVVKVIRGIMT